MHASRTSYLSTTGRRVSVWLSVGTAAILVGCSSGVRARVMHFFFEYPAPATPETQPTDEARVLFDETSFPIEVEPRFASRHPPFIKRECQKCHTRGISQSPRPDFMAACQECHQPLFAYRRYTHGPVALRECRFCHFMHVSQQKTLLKAPQADLCTQCHPAQQNERALSSYHKDIEALRCTACHDPHFADNRFLLKPPPVRQNISRKPEDAGPEGDLSVDTDSRRQP